MSVFLRLVRNARLLVVVVLCVVVFCDKVIDFVKFDMFLEDHFLLYILYYQFIC